MLHKVSRCGFEHKAGPTGETTNEGEYCRAKGRNRTLSLIFCKHFTWRDPVYIVSLDTPATEWIFKLKVSEENPIKTWVSTDEENKLN